MSNMKNYSFNTLSYFLMVSDALFKPILFIILASRDTVFKWTRKGLKKINLKRLKSRHEVTKKHPKMKLPLRGELTHFRSY